MSETAEGRARTDVLGAVHVVRSADSDHHNIPQFSDLDERTGLTRRRAEVRVAEAWAAMLDALDAYALAVRASMPCLTFSAGQTCRDLFSDKAHWCETCTAKAELARREAT